MGSEPSPFLYCTTVNPVLIRSPATFEHLRTLSCHTAHRHTCTQKHGAVAYWQQRPLSHSFTTSLTCCNSADMHSYLKEDPVLLLACQTQRLPHKLIKTALGEGFLAVIYCFRVICSIGVLVVNSTCESRWNVKPLLWKSEVHSFK